jgi:hypothetical protein
MKRWKEDGMPRLLNDKEENQKALSFLKQRGFDKLDVDQVQLWFTIVRDGELAKYRVIFQERTGLELATLTKEDLIRIHKVGDELFAAIQEEGETYNTLHVFVFDQNTIALSLG